MHHGAKALIALTGAVLLSSCGGQLGHDSPVMVRMDNTQNTLGFGSDHVIVSPNNGSSGSINAVSDIQPQSWAQTSTNLSEKEIDFTTSSQQVPYFLYVQNTGANADEVRLRIYMDGNLKYDHVLTIPASTTTQENTIFRNNVQNP